MMSKLVWPANYLIFKQLLLSGKVILLVVISFAITGKLSAQQKIGTISTKEKTKLVEIILSKTDFGIERANANTTVYLSDENISSFFSLPQTNVDSFTIKLLTAKELSVKKTGSFKYYAFEPLIVKKNTVIVTLKLVYIKPAASFYDGISYRCKYNRRVWRCTLSGFVSSES